MVNALNEIIELNGLSEAKAASVMEDILDGAVRPEQIAAILVACHARPPRAGELAGFARTLRARMVPVLLPPRQVDELVDVCGTGGDGQNTFNISTAAAFTAAAGGQPIAKNGNRAVSSKCGSFDVLEALGVPFSNTSKEAKLALDRFGLAFLYAPSFHSAFRELAGFRTSLGIRTIFNALGPLLNPTGLRRQLLGVYSPEIVIPMAEALGELGALESLVVASLDGGDELSLSAPTRYAHLKNGSIVTGEFVPEDFSLTRVPSGELRGGSSATNAQIILQVLGGEPGPASDVVSLNAGAALMIGGRAETLGAGVQLARSVLSSGNAQRLLLRMRESMNSPSVSTDRATFGEQP